MKINPTEREIITAFDKGRMKSVATKAQLAKLKSAARATGNNHREVVNSSFPAAISATFKSGRLK